MGPSSELISGRVTQPLEDPAKKVRNARGDFMYLTLAQDFENHNWTQAALDAYDPNIPKDQRLHIGYLAGKQAIDAGFPPFTDQDVQDFRKALEKHGDPDKLADHLAE